MTENDTWPPSTCVECGEQMPSGQTKWCNRGGMCSHYIPHALHEHILRIERKIEQEFNIRSMKMPEIKVGQIWGSTEERLNYLRRTVTAVTSDTVTYTSSWTLGPETFEAKTLSIKDFLNGSKLLQDV